MHPTGEDGFPFLSRHGPGKTSVRSLQSNKLSLPEIAEVELPMTLTQEALDEADRLMAAGEEHGDDDTIRETAHQHIDMDFDMGLDMDLGLTPNANIWGTQSAPAHGEMPQDYVGYGAPQPPLQGAMGQHHTTYDPNPQQDSDRPVTARSGATYDQAQAAFRDFDGVHCDPDQVGKPSGVARAPPCPRWARRQPDRPAGQYRGRRHTSTPKPDSRWCTIRHASRQC